MTTSKTLPPDEFGDPKRAKMLRQVSADSPSRARLFRRVYAGTASPRQAIKAQCLHCVWMDVAAIRGCTATACPLWRLRPFQPKAE
jgi:hypothetical protein